MSAWWLKWIARRTHRYVCVLVFAVSPAVFVAKNCTLVMTLYLPPLLCAPSPYFPAGWDIPPDQHDRTPEVYKGIEYNDGLGHE